MKSCFAFGTTTVAHALLLTILVTTARGQGAGGFALSFAGINDHVVVASNANLALSNRLTFEAWVYSDTVCNNTILSRGDGGNGATTDFIFQLGYDGTSCATKKLGFFAAGVWDATASAIPSNTWVHVAVTYDGTNKQFFINGVLDGTVERRGTIFQSGSPLYIGRQGSVCNCNFFKGEIDELRIWNIVRTPAEISANVNRFLTGTENGLIAYYRFNEGSGTTTLDTTASQAHGILTNGVTWVASGTPLAPLPLTGDESFVTHNSALLNGYLFVGNPPETTCWFEYGTSTNYSSVTSVATTNLDGSVDIAITDLLAGSQYHYRFVASNTVGAAYGEDRTLDTSALTLPIAYTDFPSSVSSNSAVMNGYFDVGVPAETFYWFQYGSTTNYGFTSPTLTNDFSDDASFALTYLPVAAHYHYRLVASNEFGVAYGEDMTLTTISFVNTFGLTGVAYGAAAWGDFDSDGHLDVLLSGEDYEANYFTQIWRNRGDGTFTNIQADLPGVTESMVAWCDFDNDGHLDFFLGGYDQTNQGLSQIWRNLGNGMFTNIDAGLPGLSRPGVAWGDYNNDGRPDLLICGDTDNQRITEIWRNLGNGTFTNINAELPGVGRGTVAWGDYDNDGYLDILMAGADARQPIAAIWRNLGNGTFTNIEANLPGAFNGAGIWADLDNDAYLDVVLNGRGNGPLPGTIWLNQHDGSFTGIDSGLLPVSPARMAIGDYDNDGGRDLLSAGYAGFLEYVIALGRNRGDGTFSVIDPGISSDIQIDSAAWGDANNDGKLDLLISGGDFDAPRCQIYESLLSLTNHPPGAPVGLNAQRIGFSGGAILRWSAAADLETPTANLTYNVRMGTRPGASDIIAPSADTNGFRRLPQPGNAQHRHMMLVTNLNLEPGNTYYWSVQAVDGAYAGSAFAPEHVFTLRPSIDRFTRLGNGQFRLQFDIAGETNYTIDASSDLQNWSPVSIFTFDESGTILFTDPDAVNHPTRFYRLGQR